MIEPQIGEIIEYKGIRAKVYHAEATGDCANCVFSHPWAVFTNLGQFIGSFLSKKNAIAFINLSYKEK